MKWLSHFGLNAPPFSKEIGDADLWVPATRRRLVDDLVEACHEHGHVLLTGEPGVGKTCVLRALRHRLPQDGFRLTYCHNATLGRRDFYRHVCLAIGLSPKATAAAVFYAIHEHVQLLGTERVHPVFLLDEAHLLHQDVLEHLHILGNYEWDAKAAAANETSFHRTASLSCTKPVAVTCAISTASPPHASSSPSRRNSESSTETSSYASSNSSTSTERTLLSDT